jgi:Holliday junction DNA helicase RuvB
VLNVPMSDDGANEIAKALPRNAAHRRAPARRVRDFAIVDGDAIVTRSVADKALTSCSMSMRSASTRWTGATSP